MDAADIADLQQAVEELMDQTCTVSNTAGVLGTFPCLVLPVGLGGGISGSSPDVRDAMAAGLAQWQAYLPIESEAVVHAGARLDTSNGLSIAIAGSDVGRSIRGFVNVYGVRQETATPYQTIVLSRWNPATLTWTALPPQLFQTLLGDPIVVGEGDAVQRQQSAVTLIGLLNADIAVNDRFTYDGGDAVVEAVVRSDRTEAVGRVRW